MSEREHLQPVPASQMEALETAIQSYQDRLTVPAARYLQARGIGQQEAATARLGVVVEPFAGHSRYQGMLAIPYLDKAGRPLTVRFRCMEEHEHRDYFHGKYNSIAGDPGRLYNVAAIHRAAATGDEIHVTEGELDSIILNKIGLMAVALPGASTWRPHHRRMLAGFNKVYVWGDDDDAGAEFVQKITHSMRSAVGVNIRGGDVTDNYLAHGAQHLLDLAPRRSAAA